MKKTAVLEYNMTTDRYEIEGVALHAGYPVDVIRDDGSVFQTSIEHDDQGWYLVKWSDRNIGGLIVDPSTVIL